MLPDSRRPRRLAIVISEIERKAISIRMSYAPGPDRLDLGDGRGRRHGDGHDVVDQQRGGGDQPEDGRQVRARHDVRAAAARIGATDLPVRHRHDGQQDRDRDRDLDRQEHRARARQQQDAQDLLGRVGRRADRIGAEDRERLGLAQALGDLLFRRQRPPEHDPAHAREEPARRCQGDVGGRLGDERVRPHVPEERCVRTLDAHAPIRRLATPQGAPSSDHMDSDALLGSRAAGQWPRRYGTSAMTVCSRPTSAAFSRLAVWLYSNRSHQWRATYSGRTTIVNGASLSGGQAWSRMSR